MIKVLEVAIEPQFSEGFMYVTFEIANTTENLSDYQFDILRSDASNGEFEYVGINIKNFEFKDYSVNLLNDALEYYYKIRITNKLTDESYDTDVEKTMTYNSEKYFSYLKIMNKMYLEDVIANPPVKYLKKKRFGQYCECYDDVREKSTKQNCTKCYGTKFDGGYYPPIDIYVNYMSSPTKPENMSVTGTTIEETPMQLWTGDFPVISQGDVIVLHNGFRYRVISWASTDKGEKTLRQILQVQKIPYSDVIYKFPV